MAWESFHLWNKGLGTSYSSLRFGLLGRAYHIRDGEICQKSPSVLRRYLPHSYTLLPSPIAMPSAIQRTNAARRVGSFSREESVMAFNQEGYTVTLGARGDVLNHYMLSTLWVLGLMNSTNTSLAYCKYILNILSQYLYNIPSAEHAQHFYNAPSHMISISRLGNWWGNSKSSQGKFPQCFNADCSKRSLQFPKQRDHNVLSQ